jgi:spore coat polysaccharide biosynthesis protein SpsF
MSNTTVIIQARMGSTRLPGKVLLNIVGKPMLYRLIERVKNSKNTDQIVIATTDSPLDDAIEKFALSNKINCYRGSENDVLDRFYHAAKEFDADPIVRITGDCPLMDSEILDKVIQAYFDNDVDYESNTQPPTYPDGLDVEVFSFAALEKMWNEAEKQSEREHVTPYIYNNPSIFKMDNVVSDEDLSDVRLTVDEKEDLQVVSEVFKALYAKNKNFSLRDILKFMVQNPELFQSNAKFQRNEGYMKSILEDDEKTL